MRRLAASPAAAVLVAGCGEAPSVREPDLVLRGASPAPPGRRARRAAATIRIAVVTHGQASSKFWSIVRNGIDAGGARDERRTSTYRSPDMFCVQRMRD